MLNFAHQEHIHSYYYASKNLDIIRPHLDKPLSADVCVIGAGFGGLSAALELAEKGKQVIVLEGARIGFGASGRSGGQAINGFEDGIDQYIKRFGLDITRQLWEMSLEAIDIIDERITKYDIRCDWKKGYATVALNSRRMDDLIAIERPAAKPSIIPTCSCGIKTNLNGTSAATFT